MPFRNPVPASRMVILLFTLERIGNAFSTDMKGLMAILIRES